MLILILFLSESTDGISYDENEWGRAFLIMITNNSMNNVTLLFPDDPSSKRIIPKGGVIGKQPMSSDQASNVDTKTIANAKNDAAKTNDSNSVVAASGSVSAGAGVLASMASTYLPVVTGRNSLSADGFPTIENSALSRKPVLSGLGTTMVSGINENLLLTLKPMKGQGGAWLQPAEFSIPNSLSFQIYVKDKGSVAIIFSDEPKNGARLKIEFGAENNNKVNISVDDHIVDSVTTADVPAAALSPGRLKSFWISFTETDILLGSGTEVGKLCFLCTTIPDLDKLTKQIGLLSFDNEINIANIKIKVPIKTDVAQDRQLLITGPTTEQFSLLSKGIGSLLFENSNPKNLSNFVLKFQGDGNMSALVTINSGTGNIKILPQDANDDTKTSLAETSFKMVAGLPNINLSVSDGCMIVSQVSANLDKTRLIKVFPNAIWNTCQTFSFQNGAADPLLKVSLGSPISSSLDLSAGSSGKLKFQGNLAVIKAFQYEFDQQGPAIICTDKIGGESFVLGKAAQQKAYYSFQATINSEGLVDINWFLPPINPTKMLLKFTVGVTNYMGQTMLNMANKTQEEAEAAEQGIISASLYTDWWDADIKPTEEVAAEALAGGLITGASNAESAAIDDSFRQEKDSYVFQEKMTSNAALKSSVSDQAKINRVIVDQKLAIIGNKTLVTREDYDFMIGEVSAIIGLVDNPYVAAGNLKSVLSKKLDELFGLRENFLQSDTTKDEYGRVIPQATKGINLSLLKLLVAGCNNDNLVTAQNSQDSVFSKKVFTDFETLSQSYFSFSMTGTANSSDNAITVPCSGKAVYLTNQVLSNGKGSIIFKARGGGDLGIILLNKTKINELTTGNLIDNEALYQIIIGENQNQLLSVRSAFNATAAKTVSNTSSCNFALDQLDFNDYWLNLDAGVLRVGTGILGQNECLSLTLPFALQQDTAVCISSPVSDNEICGFAAGPPISALSSQLLQMLQSLKDETIAEKNYLTLTPTSSTLDLGIIQNSSGTLFSKLWFFKELPILTFTMYNAKFNINYNLLLTVTKASVTTQDSVDSGADSSGANTSDNTSDNASADTGDNTTDNDSSGVSASDASAGITSTASGSGAANKPASKFDVLLQVFRQPQGLKIKEATVGIAADKIPFWLEVADRILSIGFANFWEDEIDFSVMIPDFDKCDVDISLLPKNTSLQLLSPAILAARKTIDYAFLSFLSGGIIGIPKTQAQISAEKEKKARDAINDLINNEKKTNPLFKDLQQEDKTAFADLLYYSAMDDRYDTLVYDNLEMQVDSERDWQDVLTSDTLANQDLLSQDMLTTSDGNTLHRATHAETGAMARMQMQGLAGAIGQQAQDVGQSVGAIKGAGKRSAYIVKKGLGLYGSQAEADKAKKDLGTSIFGAELDKGKKEVANTQDMFLKAQKQFGDFLSRQKNSADKHDQAPNEQHDQAQEKSDITKSSDIADTTDQENSRKNSREKAKDKLSMDNKSDVATRALEAFRRMGFELQLIMQGKTDYFAKKVKSTGQKAVAGVKKVPGAIKASVQKKASEASEEWNKMDRLHKAGAVVSSKPMAAAGTGLLTMESGDASTENQDSVVAADINDQPDSSNLTAAQKAEQQYTNSNLLAQDSSSLSQPSTETLTSAVGVMQELDSQSAQSSVMKNSGDPISSQHNSNNPESNTSDPTVGLSTDTNNSSQASNSQSSSS